MSDIYRDSVDDTVELGVAGATINSVTFMRHGKVVSTATTSPAQVPYAVTHVDGEFSVLWEYEVDGNTYSRSEDYKVVTPLFTSQELKDFNEQFNVLTDQKVEVLERLVREVIEAITGQSFGYEEGSYTTWGGGDTVLLTDKRVLSVTSIGYGQYGLLPYTYRPIKNGFGIEKDGELWDGSTYTTAGPMRSPYALHSSSGFQNNTRYTITGTFGWSTVPREIKDAALLIAELFSCKEASWRDRYLKAVTAADWRFDFDSRAFTGTGSVTADRLLEKFVVGRWAII
jgi:hypothetical protein